MDKNKLRKERRYLLFRLSIFDCMTDEERILFDTKKRAKADEKETATKLFKDKISSYEEIRKIERTKLYKDNNEHRDDKVVSGFENEAVRLCESFISFEFDKKDQKKIPLIDEFIIMDCTNELLLKQIVERGIVIDDSEYTVYSSSANQQKKKQVCLIKKDFYETNKSKLLCGLTLDIINKKGGCNTGKYLAYTSLVFSKSVELPEKLSIDEVIVLPEFETLVHDKVNFLDMEKQTIEEKEMAVPVNHMDGAGIFIPGTLPCSAQIRGGFIKGCVFPFDFQKFIDEKQQEGKILPEATIKDAWGNPISIKYIRDNIKMILNASQLKMWKYYNSWDEYKKAFKENELEICINNTMHYPKSADPIVPSAYQFYQTIPRENITDEKIEKLCKRTIDTIERYKTDNSAVLEIMGIGEDEFELEPFYACLRDYKDMVYDPYVRKRVASKIDNIRNMGRSGKPYIQGFYNYICPDLYAACEYWLCGEKIPNGLIPRGSVYNSFYNDKDIDEVCCLRSPHLSDGEHGIRKLIKNEECRKWFSGMDTVISTHDLLTKTLQADVDGDETLITHDEAFIDLLDRSKLPLYYEMRKSSAVEVNNDNIYECLCRSFNNSKVGLISNALTKHLNAEEEPDLEFVRFITAYNNFCIDYPKSQYMPELKAEHQDKMDMLNDKLFPYFFQYAKKKKSTQCYKYCKKNEQDKKEEQSTVNRISKYIMDNTKNNKDNIWTNDIGNDCKFNPQYFQLPDYHPERSSEEYRELQCVLDELVKLNTNAYREKLEKRYSDRNKRLVYNTFYYLCNHEIFAVIDKHYRNTEKISARQKAAALVLDIAYYQKNSSNKHIDVLWNCFGDILYENLTRNSNKEKEIGEKIEIKRLAYQSQSEVEKEIEQLAYESKKELEETNQVDITEKELEYIKNIPCRKNCKRDIWILYILLVLYKRKQKFLEMEENKPISDDNSKHFRIYKQSRRGKVTRAKIDNWMGGISIAKKGIERLEKAEYLKIESCKDYDKIYLLFLDEMEIESDTAFTVINSNPMLDYYKYTEEAKIGQCKVCKKDFVVIGNTKTCSAVCSKKLEQKNKKN